MRLQTYFAGLALVGLVFANPVRGMAQDEFAAGPDDSAMSAVEPGMEESTMDESAASESQPYDLAEVAFCYAGSALDPATGETVDLYSLCSDDLERA